MFVGSMLINFARRCVERDPVRNAAGFHCLSPDETMGPHCGSFLKVTRQLLDNLRPAAMVALHHAFAGESLVGQD
jgi:hypothetical protein